MKIEHIAINIPDPAAAAQWYCDHLEMTIVRSSGDVPPYIRFVADKDKTGVLELYCNPDAAVPDYSRMHPITLHIAFQVDDLQATLKRLLDAGGVAEGDVNTTPAGDQLVFVRDPWGVTLQLVKRAQPLL